MMQLTTLANGLRVATRPMQSVETIAVGLYAETGSRHEEARVGGLAHLFEHMVFKGAGSRNAREISEAIEDVGGDLNAMTDRDSTVFTATLLAEHLPLGVEVIADLIQRPHFAPSELVREKQVVLQELGEARDTPSDIIFDNLWEAAFADQALGRPVLGDEASLAAITLDDLHGWRERQYCAGSLCLVAAGKLDHDRLVDLAQQAFGDLQAGNIAADAAGRFGAGAVAAAGPSDQAHLAFAWPAPGQRDADYYAARLFADAAGGGMSSRLFQAVREDRGLAYSVYASHSPYHDCGLISAYAATAARDAAAAAALIEEVMADTAETLTPRELERVRAQAKAGLLMALESTWGQASYVARMLALHGCLVEPAEISAALDTVTLDQVRAAGAAMLTHRPARATIGADLARAA